MYRAHMKIMSAARMTKIPFDKPLQSLKIPRGSEG